MRGARLWTMILAALACVVAFGASLPQEAAVERVIVVFKTHLDVGYTDLSSKVEELYVKDFIPKAMDTIEALEAEGGEVRYNWTVGAWLIDKFLKVAKPEEVARLEKHLRRGTISWTAVPYTVESELLSRPLFSAMLGLSQRLDKAYGKRTVAAKMTDVPGHTRGIVAPLAKAGVMFLSVGVNGGSAVPQVPPFCRWRAPTGEEVVLMYQREYGGTDLLPDGKTALSLNFTGDNHGPHTVDQVKKIYANLRKRFPNAKLEAGTLNDVAKAVESMRERLPVVTSEIGDTWVYGFASDPLLMARFRAVQRLFDRWVAEGKIDPASDFGTDLSVALGFVAEHTWGIRRPGIAWGWEAYEPKVFREKRTTEEFRRAERSWAEIAARLTTALAKLPADLKTEAETAIAETTRITERPVPSKEPAAEPWKAPLPYGVGTVNVCYQTLDAADYERFFARYAKGRARNTGSFGKPGLEKSQAVSAVFPAHPAGMLTEKTPAGERTTWDVVFPTAGAHERELLPRRVQVSTVRDARTPRRWVVEVTLFDKPAVRLPEAYWVRFNVPGLLRLFADKTGERVDLLDVVPGGARRQHGVGDSVELLTEAGTLRIRPEQAFLLNVGKEMGLSYGTEPPDLSGGVQFCLFNNFWNTNFRTWYEGTVPYRFTVDWFPAQM